MFENPMFLAILLTILALGIVALELFIPSHGILGFLAIACLIGAILFAFRHSTSTGIVFVSLAVVGVPVVVITLIQWWPQTSLGKKIAPEVPPGDELLPDNSNLKALLGMKGVARSVMLPSGAIKIEGRTYDAISDGMAIESGQTVEVVAIKGNRIVVKAIDENIGEDSQENPVEANTDTSDVLSKSIDSLGLDPLDDPLA